jgi:hypothetical protein
MFMQLLGLTCDFAGEFGGLFYKWIFLIGLRVARFFEFAGEWVKRHTQGLKPQICCWLERPQG